MSTRPSIKDRLGVSSSSQDSSLSSQRGSSQGGDRRYATAKYHSSYNRRSYEQERNTGRWGHDRFLEQQTGQSFSSRDSSRDESFDDEGSAHYSRSRHSIQSSDFRAFNNSQYSDTSDNSNEERGSGQRYSGKRSYQNTFNSQPTESFRPEPRQPPRVLAIGDSFVGPLRLFRDEKVHVEKIKGASARGLANPNSTTGANQTTLDAISKYISNIQYYENGATLQAKRAKRFQLQETTCDPSSIQRLRGVLLFFGTVDLQVNLFYKLSTQPDLDVDKFVKECMDKYMDFVRELFEDLKRQTNELNECIDERYFVLLDTKKSDKYDAWFKGKVDTTDRGLELVVCSAFLPVVEGEVYGESVKRYMAATFQEDEETKNKVFGQLDKLLKEKPELAELSWREGKIRQFNEHLQAKCNELGITYLDVNDGLLDEEGHVRDYYRDNSAYNMHVLWEQSMPIWLDRLKRFGVVDSDLKNSLEDTYSEYRTWKNKQLTDLGIPLRERKAEDENPDDLNNLKLKAPGPEAKDLGLEPLAKRPKPNSVQAASMSKNFSGPEPPEKRNTQGPDMSSHQTASLSIKFSVSETVSEFSESDNSSLKTIGSGKTAFDATTALTLPTSPIDGSDLAAINSNILATTGSEKKISDLDQSESQPQFQSNSPAAFVQKSECTASETCQQTDSGSLPPLTQEKCFRTESSRGTNSRRSGKRLNAEAIGNLWSQVNEEKKII